MAKLMGTDGIKKPMARMGTKPLGSEAKAVLGNKQQPAAMSQAMAPCLELRDWPSLLTTNVTRQLGFSPTPGQECTAVSSKKDTFW